MQISAIGVPTKTKLVSTVKGFSLIELLVALFVIVLMTSLVSLNLSSGADDRLLRDQLEALADGATYALDEAQFTGSDFGLLFVRSLDERGNERVTAKWRQRLPAGWREPESSPDVFLPIVFTEAADPQLLLDDVDANIFDGSSSDQQSGVAPQWLFTSSGETQAGELAVWSESKQSQLQLRWDALGRFEWPGDSFED